MSLQLQRRVREPARVAVRCPCGLPAVVETHPLAGGSPFPTLYWLTCPLLVKRASKLEAAGRMRELNEHLEDSPLSARLADAIERLRARRDEHAVVSDGGSPPGGGPRRVKCLHAHVAHELADPPNPVGALVIAQVGWPDCRVPCVEKAP